MAIEIVSAATLPYDFIFMDINMPVLNGYEVSVINY